MKHVLHKHINAMYVMSCRMSDSSMCFMCIFCTSFQVLHLTFQLFETRRNQDQIGSSASSIKPESHFMIYFCKGTHYIRCNVCTTINVITMTTETMTFLRCSLQLTSQWRLHQHYMINTIIACYLTWNCSVCVCM